MKNICISILFFNLFFANFAICQENSSHLPDNNPAKFVIMADEDKLKDVDHKEFFKTEHDPLSGALYLAKKLEGRSREKLLIDIAQECDDAKQNKKALEILSIAFQTARTIAEPDLKAGAMIQVAEAYLRKGQKDKTYEVLQVSLEAARATKDNERKITLLALAAYFYADAGNSEEPIQLLTEILQYIKSDNDAVIAGQLHQILQAYEKIPEKKYAGKILHKAFDIARKEMKLQPLYGRDMVLLAILRCYEATENFEQVIEDVKIIQTLLSEKAWTFTTLACKCAKAGQNDKSKLLLSKAIETARQLENGKYNETVAGIASVCLRENLCDQAYEISKDIESPSLKAKFLSLTAYEYFMNGQKEKSASAFSRAIYAAIDEKDAKSKSLSLVEIAGYYECAGEKEKSSELLAKAMEAGKGIADEKEKELFMFKASKQYLSNGLSVKAFDIAGRLKDPENKVLMMIKIADKFAKDGQMEKAEKIFSQALESTKKSVPPPFTPSLEKIAYAFIDAGHLSYALEIARIVEEESPSSKCEIMFAVVEKYAESDKMDLPFRIADMLEGEAYGVWELALDKFISVQNDNRKQDVPEILLKILDKAEKIEDPDLKSFVLGNIAVKYHALGQQKKSDELLLKVFETAKSIEDTGDRDRIFYIISGKFASAGSFAKSLDTVKEIKRIEDRSLALAFIGLQYMKSGQEPGEDEIAKLRGIIQEE